MQHSSPFSLPPYTHTSAQQTVANTLCPALPAMYAHWARRSQRLLVLNAGLGFHLQCLWEAGFDVTAHATTSQDLLLAKSILGTRADYMLSQSEFLMCDDQHFDYALYLGPLETHDMASIRKQIREIHRVTASGLIVVFVNIFSLHALGQGIRKLQKKTLYATGYPPRNPLFMRYILKKEFPTASFHWFFTPIIPRLFSHNGRYHQRVNRLMRWSPLSALYGVRIDFTPQPGCTGLVLQTENIHA